MEKMNDNALENDWRIRTLTSWIKIVDEDEAASLNPNLPLSLR